MITTNKIINVYGNHPGGGLCDIGHLKLTGWTLVEDDELKALRIGTQGEVEEVLNLARAALTRRDGTPISRRAQAAVYRIDELLGEAK